MSFTAAQIGGSLQVSGAVGGTSHTAHSLETSAAASAVVPFKHHIQEIWTEEVGQLVHVPALCSKAIYGDEYGRVNVPVFTGYNISQRSLISPANSGRLKSSGLFEVERIGTRTQTKTFVAAIRGSASIADWLVNFDNCLSPCPDLLDITFGLNQLQAHRGFAQSARMLVPRFYKELTALLSHQNTEDIDVVFTGDSARGAVATLIYAHFLLNKFQHPIFNKATLRFSCITFGAPPIFNAAVTSAIEDLRYRSSRQGLLLAFVADGDPVVRMDAAYAKLVAYLYYQASADEYDPSIGDKVQLPPLSLFRLGKLVMLTDTNISGDGLDLRAYSIQEDDLSRWLWANLFAHKKTLHAE